MQAPHLRPKPRRGATKATSMAAVKIAPPDRDAVPMSPCGIVSYISERVELDCGSAAGGYAVQLGSSAPTAEKRGPGSLEIPEGEPALERNTGFEPATFALATRQPGIHEAPLPSTNQHEPVISLGVFR